MITEIALTEAILKDGERALTVYLAGLIKKEVVIRVEGEFVKKFARIANADYPDKDIAGLLKISPVTLSEGYKKEILDAFRKIDLDATVSEA
jgi:hypothetical protein